MAHENESDQGQGALQQCNTYQSWLNPMTWLNSWKYSSMAALAQFERKILQSVWHKLEEKFIPISNGTKSIRTIALNTESKNTPLVLVHGMGSGVGLWILNLESLSKNRPLYAFDVLGFGRSTRPKFSKDALLAETEFIESMEEWRRAVGLERFILLGHSLGGFLASSYAIRYPDKVRHLVLVDPWGFPEKPSQQEQRVPVPIWIKVVATMLQPFNPLAVLRAAGPWGPGLVSRFRPDLTRKFEHLFDDDTVSQYVFHCNAQTPSGEIAFKHMTIPFGWAKHPMILRMAEIPRLLPITVIYGSRSWVDSGIGYQIKYIRNDSYVDVQVVKGAGHHVYADKAYQFNAMVNRVCQTVDNRMDFGQPYSSQSIRQRSQNSETTPDSSGSRLTNSSPRRKIRCESMPTFSKVQKQIKDEDSISSKVSNAITETPETTLPDDQSDFNQSSEPTLDPKRISFVLGDDYLPKISRLDTDESNLTGCSDLTTDLDCSGIGNSDSKIDKASQKPKI